MTGFSRMQNTVFWTGLQSAGAGHFVWSESSNEKSGGTGAQFEI